MRWEWERVIVASQDIASVVVRAFIVFRTLASSQHTICSSHLSVLAESGKHSVSLNFLAEPSLF